MQTSTVKIRNVIDIPSVRPSELDCSQLLYLAHAKGNASEASAKHAGVGVGFSSEASKKRIERLWTYLEKSRLIRLHLLLSTCH